MLHLGRPTRDFPAPTPERTMRAMSLLAQQAQRDSAIRILWERITHGIWPQDYLSEYAAVLNWVRRNVRYSRDPVTIEQVKTPRAVLETRTADCDDLATLIAALCSVGGARTRFTAGGFKRGPGGKVVLAHVWCEAYDPGTRSWIVLDPVPGRNVGNMLGKLAGKTLSMPAVE